MSIQSVNRPIESDKPMPSRRDRTPIYKGIAFLLWKQYVLENDIQSTPFEQAPADFKRTLLEHSEALANMALEPDLRDAALMALADDLCRANSCGDRTISEVSRQTAMSYLTTAESALQAFLLNLMTKPFDPAYRDSMSRLIDSLAPKRGVQ